MAAERKKNMNKKSHTNFILVHHVNNRIVKYPLTSEIFNIIKLDCKYTRL